MSNIICWTILCLLPLKLNLPSYLIIIVVGRFYWLIVAILFCVYLIVIYRSINDIINRISGLLVVIALSCNKSSTNMRWILELFNIPWMKVFRVFIRNYFVSLAWSMMSLCLQIFRDFGICNACRIKFLISKFQSFSFLVVNGIHYYFGILLHLIKFHFSLLYLVL